MHSSFCHSSHLFALTHEGVTDTVFAFGRGVLNTVSDGFGTMINRGTDPSKSPNKTYKTYSSKNKNVKKNRRDGNKNNGNGLFGFLPRFISNSDRIKNKIRGRNINPWRPFWQFITLEKKVEKKRTSWFEDIRRQSQNVGNRLSLE